MRSVRGGRRAVYRVTVAVRSTSSESFAAPKTVAPKSVAPKIVAVRWRRGGGETGSSGEAKPKGQGEKRTRLEVVRIRSSTEATKTRRPVKLSRSTTQRKKWIRSSVQ
eukprot:6256361-Prymnesium_polylepis.1